MGTRIAGGRVWTALLLGSLLWRPPPVALGGEGTTGSGADASSEVKTQLQEGFRAVCTARDGVRDAEFRAEVSRLATALAPLLSPDLDDRARLQYATLAAVRSRFEHSQAMVATYDELSTRLAGAQPGELPLVLERLSAMIDDIEALRATRASVARLVPDKTGGIHLELCPIATPSSLEDGVAEAALAEFSLASARGIDCHRSSVYEFFHARSLLIERGEPPVALNHRDIQALRSRVGRLEAACGAGGGRRTCDASPTMGDVVSLFRDVKHAHERAVDVLGRSLDLFVASLRASGGLGDYPAALVADFPDPEKQEDVEITAVAGHRPDGVAGSEQGTPTVTTAHGGAPAETPQTVAGSPGHMDDAQVDAEAGVADGDRGSDDGDDHIDTAVLGGEDATGGKQAPVEARSAVAADGDPGGDPSAAESEAEVGAVARDASARIEAAVAQRRMQTINEVMAQANVLRGAAEEGIIDPLALAYNLLQRSKRIFELADMLAVSDQDGKLYHCELSGGTIHIAYETAHRALARMEIVVDEAYLGRTVMTWTLTVTRKNDRNFSISAAFGKMNPSLVVERGKLVRMPDHQELLVLMNRLSALVFGDAQGAEPVRTASR